MSSLATNGPSLPPNEDYKPTMQFFPNTAAPNNIHSHESHETDKMRTISTVITVSAGGPEVTVNARYILPTPAAGGPTVIEEVWSRNGNGEKEKLAYLRIFQLAQATLTASAYKTYANVTRVKIINFIDDLATLFSFTDAFPKLQEIVFANDAIWRGKLVDTSRGKKSTTRSVKKIFLQMDDKTQASVGKCISGPALHWKVLELLHHCCEFFTGLLRVDLKLFATSSNLELTAIQTQYQNIIFERGNANGKPSEAEQGQQQGDGARPTPATPTPATPLTPPQPAKRVRFENN